MEQYAVARQQLLKDLGAKAEQQIQESQRRNRLQYFKILQRRKEPLVYDVSPGDLVLVADRPRKGLAPKFIGPFRVHRVTASGSVVLETDATGPHGQVKRWRVKQGRVYPYLCSHQTRDFRQFVPPAGVPDEGETAVRGLGLRLSITAVADSSATGTAALGLAM